MGWLILVALVAASLGCAARCSACAAACSRPRAAALLLGASGYALQGRPSTGGCAARSRAKARGVLPLTERGTPSSANSAATESGCCMSEALARSGNTEDAVGILQNAVRRYPGRSAIVDRARQRAGRPCAWPDPARRAGLSSARPSWRPTIRRRRFFYGLGAGAVGRPRRRASRCGRTCWQGARRTRAGGLWSRSGIAALDQPRR